MTYQNQATLVVSSLVASFLFATGTALPADDASDMKRQLELLRQQNATLQEQVRQQTVVIEKLNQRVDVIEQTSGQQARQMNELQADVKEAAPTGKASGAFSLGKVRLGGEGAVGFSDTQAEGRSPNSEFRVYEAKLFVESPVWRDVFFYGELYLATPDSDTLDVRLGELYLDFEDVSKLWDRERQLNVRLGRFYIPYGEEYLTRDAIDNPLILHSLPDMWGVDEGLELYGALGKFSYAVAVQNGGISGTHDFTSDKSVAGRLGYDPTPWLHLSVSGMRTGDLEANEDYLSELWFGGGWFRSIGGTNTTTFGATLFEGDVDMRFSRGSLKAFGGYVHYDDNDPDANNERHMFYYSVEGVWQFYDKFYAVARFSQIFADRGYPLPGNANMDNYFFNPYGPQAEDLWRLSLGLGYSFSDQLVLKFEYALEHGDETDGSPRDDVNFYGVQAAFKF